MPQFLLGYYREPRHTPTVNKECNQWPFQLKITEQGHKALVLVSSHCCISGCLLIQDSTGYSPVGFLAEWENILNLSSEYASGTTSVCWQMLTHLETILEPRGWTGLSWCHEYSNSHCSWFNSPFLMVPWVIPKE